MAFVLKGLCPQPYIMYVTSRASVFVRSSANCLSGKVSRTTDGKKSPNCHYKTNTMFHDKLPIRPRFCRPITPRYIDEVIKCCFLPECVNSTVKMSRINDKFINNPEEQNFIIQIYQSTRLNSILDDRRKVESANIVVKG